MCYVPFCDCYATVERDGKKREKLKRKSQVTEKKKKKKLNWIDPQKNINLQLRGIGFLFTWQLNIFHPFVMHRYNRKPQLDLNTNTDSDIDSFYEISLFIHWLWSFVEWLQRCHKTVNNTIKNEPFSTHPLLIPSIWFVVFFFIREN